MYLQWWEKTFILFHHYKLFDISIKQGSGECPWSRPHFTYTTTTYITSHTNNLVYKQRIGVSLLDFYAFTCMYMYHVPHLWYSDPVESFDWAGILLWDHTIWWCPQQWVMVEVFWASLQARRPFTSRALSSWKWLTSTRVRLKQFCVSYDNHGYLRSS